MSHNLWHNGQYANKIWSNGHPIMRWTTPPLWRRKSKVWPHPSGWQKQTFLFKAWKMTLIGVWNRKSGFMNGPKKFNYRRRIEMAAINRVGNALHGSSSQPFPIVRTLKQNACRPIEVQQADRISSWPLVEHYIDRNDHFGNCYVLSRQSSCPSSWHHISAPSHKDSGWSYRHPFLDAL